MSAPRHLAVQRQLAAQRADAVWNVTPKAPAEHLLLGRAVLYIGDGAEAFTDVEVQDLVAHRRHFGPRPHATGTDGAALLDTLHAIAMSGRGGGHFPVARKWRAVRDAPGVPVVVANGADGDH